MLKPQDVATYHEQGYVVARGVFTEAELEELRSACDELEDQARLMKEDTFEGVTFFALHRAANPFAKHIGTVPPVAGQLRRVTYPYALNGTFDRYRTHPRLLALASTVLGPDVKQIVNQVNFNPPGGGVGWGWHQDYRFRKAGIKDLHADFLQTLTAIDLCTRETGGLRVVPKSDRLGPLKLDYDNENAEAFFDAKTAVTPEMQPGDVILFNSHLIHGSTANNSKNKRRVYINGFARGNATVGMWVLKNGKAVPEAHGSMEYEGDRDIIPKASKY